MGARTKSRLLAVLIAAVMIMTSVTCVFASEMSSTQGSNNANTSEVSVAKGVITVNTDGEILDSSKGKISGTKITGLKEGQLVKITTTEGDSYRWVKRGVIKKATKKKVTWKKISGANYYLVKLVKNGKTTYKKISGTSATAKKLGVKSLKGYTVSVRPIKKSGGKVYSGEFSKKKKAK